MHLEMRCAETAGLITMKGEYDVHSAAVSAGELREAIQRVSAQYESYSWWKRAAYQAQTTIQSDRGPVDISVGISSISLKLPTETGLVRGSKSYVVQTCIEIKRDHMLRALDLIERQMYLKAASSVPPASSHQKLQAIETALAPAQITPPMQPREAQPIAAQAPAIQRSASLMSVSLRGGGMDGEYEICERLPDGSLRIKRLPDGLL